MSMDRMRAAVRPVVTVALVGAFIAGAFADLQAADAIKPFAGIAIGFWFASRQAAAPAPQPPPAEQPDTPSPNARGQ